MFCRFMGVCVWVSEEVVVRYVSGWRFERAYAAAAAGRTTSLEEKDLVVEEVVCEVD